MTELDSLPAVAGRTVNELFASCVRRFADATALIHGDTRLTFAELDAMSDHYAVALERTGIGPGDIVPVVMRRTPEMVALLLAVLKRGAAYSAMDPLWPGARHVALISRLRPRLVIAAAEGPWPEPTWVPPRYDPAGPRRSPSPVKVSPEDWCVVCFTSGTTGKPKCVVSPHRSLARLFDHCDWMPLGPGVTIPQVSASSWDGFVIDCWGPLLTGGTTVLVDQPIVVPAVLSELIGKHGVNVVFLVTSLFNLLVDEGLDSFAGLHTVAMAGEQASAAHIRRFLERYPDTRVLNQYGPIECGVLTSEHDVRLADCDAAGGIPLGKALPDTAIYILDGARPCEDGQVGEICIAGHALAIGYLDDDELTASKFTQISIDGAPLRVYRTGDLGHWSGDGTLRFDGRVDRQLKVRGNRVEPAEIEQAAIRVPGVTMAAVVPLRRDGMVDALALFYTSPQSQATEAALRAELSGTLPGYLVPRLIRRIDRFPQLPNGKLDYLMLEMILSAAEPDGLPSQGPRGAAETVVAGIIAKVLRVPSVPREASLFDLGGDSLAVARVCARLERATGKKVQVSQVFRTPTVAGLTAWLEAGPDPISETDRAAAPVPARLVALPPMQALLLPSPQVSDLAWWIDGQVDVDALARAATDVHRRHQALHASYISSGPDEGHALLPADPGEVSFHRLPEAGTDTEAVDALRAIVSQPVRIDEGEIWRCALVPSAASGRFLFGIGVHHAAFDGWAAGILAADLSAAYMARVAGAEPEFGAPVAGLADFDADYRRQLARTSLQAQRQYWLSELANLPTCHLPGRIAGVESFVGPVAAPAFAVEPALLRPWEAYGRSRGMPPFVWTAAACTEALIRAGAPRDFCFMVPVAKRGNDLLDRSIACRMGSVCLRPNAPSAVAPGLLSRTQDAYVRAMAAQDLFLDFREVENVIGPWAQTPAMPAMPVLLYQDNPAPVLTLGAAIGVEEEEAIGGWETSVVDLCLELRPATAERFLRVALRSDLYPADLANSIGRYFQEIIGAGPACLDG